MYKKNVNQNIVDFILSKQGNLESISEFIYTNLTDNISDYDNITEFNITENRNYFTQNGLVVSTGKPLIEIGYNLMDQQIIESFDDVIIDKYIYTDKTVKYKRSINQNIFDFILTKRGNLESISEFIYTNLTDTLDDYETIDEFIITENDNYFIQNGLIVSTGKTLYQAHYFGGDFNIDFSNDFYI